MSAPQRRPACPLVAERQLGRAIHARLLASGGRSRRSFLVAAWHTMRTTLPISASYRRAIFDALVLQVVLGALSMMLLDGGRVAHTRGIAVLAFWSGAALVIIRRPTAPMPTDLFLIRFGFLPLLIVTFALAEWVWSWHWVWRIRGV